jgi:hypothetical protein
VEAEPTLMNDLLEVHRNFLVGHGLVVCARRVEWGCYVGARIDSREFLCKIEDKERAKKKILARRRDRGEMCRNLFRVLALTLA